MKVITRWEKLEANTMRGYAVKIESTYSTYDIHEFNQFVEMCKRQIGSIQINNYDLQQEGAMRNETE